MSVPPQNLEAEEFTLGAMMISQAMIIPVVCDEQLQAGDFYLDRNRIVFEAIVRLHDRDETVQVVTVCDELNRADELERVGGKDRVASLAKNMPAPGSAAHYAAIVKRTANLRKLHQYGAEMRELRDTNGEAAAILQKIEGVLGEGLISQERRRWVDGASFALNTPDTPEALWGTGDGVLWAAGEPLMIAGPQGIGKTTLAQRLVLHRSGIRGGGLLGSEVEVNSGRVLYIAGDRPRQAARSFRRMVKEDDRPALEASLVVWPGPLPFDLGRARPGELLEFVRRFPEVDTIVVDSLKDIAVKLADDEVGSRVNSEFQRVIAAGIELVVLHHQRKASGDNKKPRALDDVYGSTWLTSGMGSVVLLWGKAGDPIVDLIHLKQPSGEVGPLTVMHDHQAGAVELHEPADPIALLKRSSSGLTAHDAAVELFGTTSPDRNEVEKARRRLESIAGVQKEKQGASPTAPVLFTLGGAS